MATLHLNLKKKWFDMIASGEKKENYSEIRDDWIVKLYNNGHREGAVFDTLKNAFKKIDKITFHLLSFDKADKSVTVEFKEIRIGIGKEEWGAKTNQVCFIHSLGKILSKNF